CRFLTTAGGYCGDATKNGPEQCDGMTPVTGITDQYACPAAGRPSQVCPYVNADCIQSPCLKTNESGVTCQQLGFDFPLNGVKPRLIALDPTLDTPRDSSCTAIDDMKRYEYLMFKECLGMRCSNPSQAPNLNIISDSGALFTRLAADEPDIPDVVQDVPWLLSFTSPMPSENAFWQCVREKGPMLGVGISVDATPQLVQCSASCSFGGCGKCSDEVGTGVIKGQLWDGVYGQVIPFARVSVFYKGILVNQVASDNDGYFTVTGLNNRPECGQYKLVVDKYDDNLCTGNLGDRPNCGAPSAPPWMYSFSVDEGDRGGYWPYTSPIFSVKDFKAIVSPTTPSEVGAQIFVYPRPATGEAYFAVTTGDWVTAAKGGRNNHLILPEQYAFAPKKGGDPVNYTPANCVWESRPTADVHHCARDVTWRSELQGSFDLDVLPHARLTCPHRPGDYTSQLGDLENGCPIEGCAACLERQGEKCGKMIQGSTTTDPGDDVYKCDNAPIFGTCSGGPTPGAMCSMNADCNTLYACSADCSLGYCISRCAGGPKAGQLCSSNTDCSDTTGTCGGLTCPNQYWETCIFVNDGPLVTYLRYSAFSGATEPLRMMFDSKGIAGEDKSVWPQLNVNNPPNSIMTILQDNDYAAVVSTEERVVYLRADDLVKLCDDKDCKFWHLADLDPTTGSLTVHNALIQERKEPTEGVAAYDSNRGFNGGWYTDGTKYCSINLGPDPQGSGVDLYELYRKCSSNEDCTRVPGSVCQAVNTVSYERATY
ncbi:hypothetical protein L0Y59_05295, partial [Candidatus Uhrbacteria bacterium]|nr:hypothetical protein [Candidatus Uhrbacteria bacterium]